MLGRFRWELVAMGPFNPHGGGCVMGNMYPKGAGKDGWQMKSSGKTFGHGGSDLGGYRGAWYNYYG